LESLLGPVILVASFESVESKVDLWRINWKTKQLVKLNKLVNQYIF
jgi:hypothetical protein